MTEELPQNPPLGAGVRRAVLPAVILCLLFVAAAVPLIAVGYDRGRGASDQDHFHLVDIRTFGREWPHLNFSDYTSATTPGYHVALAAVDRFVSDDLRVLRLAGMLFTLGLLATLAAAVGSKVGPIPAMALCLPIVCSLYVFSSGAWLQPDNAAWWGVLAVLLVALRRRVDAWTYVAGGIVLLLLVLVRQIHLWAAGVLCLAAWLGSDAPFRPALSAAKETLSSRVRRTIPMLVAVAPAVIVLVLFFRMWHGTTPPSSQIAAAGHPRLNGGNPAVPAAALGVFGVAAVFYMGWLLPALRRGDKRTSTLFGIGGLVLGFVAGALPQTSYDPAAGRVSGIWNIAPHFPTYHGGHSPIMLGLSMLGGLLLGMWLVALPRRDRWILLAAWAGFIAANSAVSMAYHRYYEPFVLITLPLMASRVASRDRTRPSTAAIAGPVLLAILLAAVTVASLR